MTHRLNDLLKNLKSHKLFQAQNYFSILTPLTIILFSIFSFDFETIISDADNNIPEADDQYIGISLKWWTSNSIGNRPLGYPFIIYILRLFIGSSWSYYLVGLQIILYSISGLIFYSILTGTKVYKKNVNAFIVTLLCFLNPQSLSYCMAISPEIMPNTFLLIAFWSSNYFFKNRESRYNYLILAIVSSFLCYLMKPIWVLAPFIIIFNQILMKKNLIVDFLKFISAYLFVFLAYSQTINFLSGNSNFVSNILDLNINLMVIRMGAIENTEQTELYKYLDSTGKLEAISARKWTDSTTEFNNFTDLKNTINRSLLYDSSFWKSALADPSNLITFTKRAFYRIPSYFSTSAESGRVSIKFSKFLNYLYQGFYSWIHDTLWFIPIIVILFLMYEQFAFKIYGNLNYYYLNTTIISVAMAIIILTYQDSLFYRMRASTEPFILFLYVHSISIARDYIIPIFFKKNKIFSI